MRLAKGEVLMTVRPTCGYERPSDATLHGPGGLRARVSVRGRRIRSADALLDVGPGDTYDN